LPTLQSGCCPSKLQNHRYINEEFGFIPIDKEAIMVREEALVEKGSMPHFIMIEDRILGVKERLSRWQLR
jgi:hypothetical protein